MIGLPNAKMNLRKIRVKVKDGEPEMLNDPALQEFEISV